MGVGHIQTTVPPLGHTLRVLRLRMLVAKNLRRSYWLVIGSGELDKLLQPIPTA